MRSAAFVTFSRRIGLVGAVACFAAATVLAAEPKPDAAIKNKIIDAGVFLDDRIKADPVLAADCLAEGRKWMDKNAAEAAVARKDRKSTRLNSSHIAVSRMPSSA